MPFVARYALKYSLIHPESSAGLLFQTAQPKTSGLGLEPAVDANCQEHHPFFQCPAIF